MKVKIFLDQNHLTRWFEVARKLSSPFPFVRLDFYEVGGKPIFGEMTFTPGFDMFCGTYGDKILKLGNWIIYQELRKLEN